MLQNVSGVEIIEVKRRVFTDEYGLKSVQSHHLWSSYNEPIFFSFYYFA
ncbi:unnamed protein product [marine sediment metagenome]|uniref:Uncharacterized protein n=1 Tax=marine sediment metagenome TaxID=412755 RepID=X1CQC9_9ZZZZ